MNYILSKWGRLSIPQTDDSNRSRWPLAPEWEMLRELIDDSGWLTNKSAKCSYDISYEITPAYLNSAVGWIAGLMARVGIKESLDAAASLSEIGQFLTENGFPVYKIEKRAKEKWRVANNLR